MLAEPRCAIALQLSTHATPLGRTIPRPPGPSTALVRLLASSHHGTHPILILVHIRPTKVGRRVRPERRVHLLPIGVWRRRSPRWDPPPAGCRDVGLRPARRCAIHGALARDVAGLITLVAPDVSRHPLRHHACGGRSWTRVLCLVSLQVATQLVVVLGITPSLVAELTMQVPGASVLPRLVGLPRVAFCWMG